MGVYQGVFEEVAGELGARLVSSDYARWVRTWTMGGVSLVLLIGGASYVEALIGVAARRGVGTILGMGLCGAVARGLSVGSVVVAYAARREDGLSDHYVDPRYPAVAHPLLLARVYTMLSSKGLDPVLALVVSRSSVLTESPEWAEEMRRQHVSCVDMETSALYVLAQLTGIEAVAVHVVSDSLVEQAHAIGSRRLRERQKRVLETLVEAAEELSREAQGAKSPSGEG